MSGAQQTDVDIVAVIDRVPLSRLQWVTIVLCGIVAILEHHARAARCQGLDLGDGGVGARARCEDLRLGGVEVQCA